MSPVIRTVCAVITLMIVPTAALADRIAVIGTGSVGGGLGPEFAALGHDVVYGSRDPSRDDVRALVERTGGNASAATPAEAAENADIVLLAVPGRLAAGIAGDLGDLSGKIIIDPTNHYERDDNGIPRMLTLPSNAEAIQAAAPGSMVVKAFNTLNWQQMVDPDSSGGPVTIPLVGDSSAAKATVAEAFIPTLDALDSAAGHNESLINPVRKVVGEAAERIGLERLEPDIGDRFDPAHHEAVANNAGRGEQNELVVNDVVRPGYRIGTRLLRAAEVAVDHPEANAPTVPDDQ